MTKIAFIGLGNMGLPMARNLLKAGLQVSGYDRDGASLGALADAGGHAAESVAEAVDGSFVVVSALPAAQHVRAVYSGDGESPGVFDAASKGALLIDCSTIDVATARALAAEARGAGLRMIDSPMSGGVGGAEAGALTFMVGGEEADVELARPFLDIMGAKVFHAGPSGAGAAAKICNNLMLAIQMIGVAEGFALADKLGLDAQRLYEISSTATARCWSLNEYCPAPGPVPGAPSNRDYKPGFANALMLKDLNLAMDEVHATGATAPLGELAARLYRFMVEEGGENLDFSSIYLLLKG